MVRWGLCVLGVVALLPSSPVQARDDMSGVWVEDYDETIVAVEQWGPHCGEAPRSAGRRNRGLKYVVEDRGVDLFFKAIGKGRSFSTSACQSSNKRLKPKERKLKDKLFLVNCATSESARSYESGLYSFRIKSIAKIEYRETSRFSRNIKGALCVHTRRVRRIYTHLIGQDPPETVARPKEPPPVPGKKVGSDREDPCRTPGKPARLKLSPRRAVLLPGDQVCPEVTAFDRQGCRTEATLSWGKGVPPRGIKLDIRGCLKAARNAPPGKKTVKLSAGSAQAKMTLVVKRRPAPRTGPGRPKRPVADQPGKRAPEATAPVDAGPPDAGRAEAAASQDPQPDAGPAEVASSQSTAPPAGKKETREDSGSAGAAWGLPVAIGGGVVILALILFVVLRRRGRATGQPPAVPARTGPVAMAAPVPDRRSPAPLDPPPQQPPSREPPPQEPPAAPAPTPPSPPTVPDPRPTTSTDQVARAFCTTCGKSIPGDAKFCPYDRTPIYRPGSPTLASAPVCPTCKRLLPMGAKFCPYDRTKLA